MKKIIIVYESGVGNTKRVANDIYIRLSLKYKVDIYSIEEIPQEINLSAYDGIIFGFPVRHSHPPYRILRFIKSMNRLVNIIPTYIFTTYGLYGTNTLRIFAKECIKKNIIPVLYRGVRCAAVDGMLLAPQMKIWFTNEKRLYDKIHKDCESFEAILAKGEYKINIPAFKMYSILNYPNKFLGQHITFPIYLHKHKCKKCKKCVINCPEQAFSIDELGYPVFSKEKCQKCYRCIHHCPHKALSLYKKRDVKRVWGE